MKIVLVVWVAASLAACNNKNPAAPSTKVVDSAISAAPDTIKAMTVDSVSSDSVRNDSVRNDSPRKQSPRNVPPSK